MIERRLRHRHLLYAAFDMVATFVIAYLTFLTFFFRSNTLTQTQTIAMFIYCGGLTLLTVIVFFSFRIYKIVTIYFSLRDAVRMAFFTSIIHIIGLIVLLVMPGDILLRPSIAAWGLGALSTLSVTTGVRLLVRGLNAIFHFKKKERIKTLVIGAGRLGKLLLMTQEVIMRIPITSSYSLMMM